MKKFRVGVIGAGGYAATHIDIIKSLEKNGLCLFSACVIRNPDKGNYKEIETDFLSKGIKVFRTYEEMLENGNLDLVTIPSSIEQHADYAITAMEKGLHVICEKPVAGTIEDALMMEDAAVRNKKILAIGYQNIFSPSIQKIKQITFSKELGKLLKAKCLVLWIRTASYHSRNAWAGKMSFNGKMIYDSPSQNSSAHFLQNLIYVAGDKISDSAEPVAIYAENYRVKNIECADTQYLKVECKNGVKLFFYATHSVEEKEDPIIEFIYEKGKIEWQYNGITKVYELQNNKYHLIDEFDNDGKPIKTLVFENTINAINNNSEPLSNIYNSIQHTVCVEKSFQSSNGVVKIPENFTGVKKFEDGDENIYIKGLSELMHDIYEKEIGFFESGISWAKKSGVIS